MKNGVSSFYMLENLCHCMQYSTLVGLKLHSRKSHLDSLVIVPFYGLCIMWADQPALGEMVVVVAVAPRCGQQQDPD